MEKREAEKEIQTINHVTTKNQLKKFNVRDLQTYLTRRQLDSTGNKNVLVDRIWDYLEQKRKNKALRQRIQQVIQSPELPRFTTDQQYHPITGQELHDAVCQFEDKDPSDFTVGEIIKVIQTLAHVSLIDMRNTSPEAMQTRDKFYYPWIAFVEAHPELKQVIDPHYIVFDFGTIGPAITAGGPPGWGGAIGGLGGIGLGGLGIAPVIPPPPAIGPPAGPVQSQYFFQVGGPPAGQPFAARHFGGFMQGRFPGLHFLDFTLAAPPMYY